MIDDVHEPARRRHRQRMQSDAAKEAYKRRLQFAELPFAVIKATFGLRRFLLRGIDGVTQEWHWATTTFNLKRLMSVWAQLRKQLNEKTKAAIA